MRRAILAFLGTVTALVMLLSFKTHPTSQASAPAALGNSSSVNTSTGSRGSSSSGGTSNKKKTKRTGKSPGSAAVTKSVIGAAENTPYGPIQVKVTVTNSKITDVSAIEYPNDPRSQQINAYAIPTLTKEAIAADSAKIDMVSGATYTSNGYIASLQSALDKAGI